MSGLAVTGVDVRLGDRLVLEGVDLDVAGGAMVALLGPNGAGKTTLLRAVLGLLPIERGQITVAGASRRHPGAGVGYVPQRHEFAWDFPISVADAALSGRVQHIGWFRRAKAADRTAVDVALERVGMADLARRPIGELSGGQRQRVLLARALALDPQVLLLDEPLTGVDVPTAELVTDLLLQLRSEGRAIVMATHDLSAAASACDRLVLLHRRVVADAPPSELRDPAIWLEAFGVPSSDQLLATLGMGVPR
ncbi:MAG: anchored repeat-type ABC transporter ATP-binding subunit [Acidimicrobiia bacterium]|nr:anchored repeat-type ABC transporter ATP-binding subunit [Acidimicrobiia bacterium]